MKRTSLLMILTFVLLLSSCGFLGDGGQLNLDGTQWTLISFEGETLIPDTTMTAFFFDDGISGSASCNHYFGSVSTRGNQIQIESVGWTEMACMNPEGIMDQEQNLMANLMLVETYSVDDQTLVIKTSNGKEFVFSMLKASE